MGPFIAVFLIGGGNFDRTTTDDAAFYFLHAIKESFISRAADRIAAVNMINASTSVLLLC